MRTGKFIMGAEDVCRKLLANTWESKYIVDKPCWLVGNLSIKKKKII